MCIRYMFIFNLQIILRKVKGEKYEFINIKQG